MEEERRCYNCAIDLTCQECDEDNSNWQPIAQEKPVEKIQYTQQEWVSIIDDLGWNPDVMKQLKQKGYIRKTAVEEAEEMYKEWLNRIGDMSETVVMDKMYLAIQEQKKENVRLSNLIRDSRE